MRQKFLAVGLLATILIVPILVLTGLMLATHDARTPPKAITSLSATDASYERYGQIDLIWSPSDAKDFAYYNIYASLKEITDVTKLSPIGRIYDRADVTYQATRYKVPELSLALFAFEEDSEYWFAVTAVDKASNESKVDTSVSATIETMPPPPPIPTVFIMVTYKGPEPATVTVPIGTTVGWFSMDWTDFNCFTITNPHTVTSDTGLFYFELTNRDVIFSYTFTEAGVFGYHGERYHFESGEVLGEYSGKVIVE